MDKKRNNTPIVALANVDAVELSAQCGVCRKGLMQDWSVRSSFELAIAAVVATGDRRGMSVHSECGGAALHSVGQQIAAVVRVCDKETTRDAFLRAIGKDPADADAGFPRDDSPVPVWLWHVSDYADRIDGPQVCGLCGASSMDGLFVGAQLVATSPNGEPLCDACVRACDVGLYAVLRGWDLLVAENARRCDECGGTACMATNSRAWCFTHRPSDDDLIRFLQEDAPNV